eukprot:6789465-Lingulodinium_polyedra.AAC.1
MRSSSWAGACSAAARWWHHSCCDMRPIALVSVRASSRSSASTWRRCVCGGPTATATAEAVAAKAEVVAAALAEAAGVPIPRRPHDEEKGRRSSRPGLRR